MRLNVQPARAIGLLAAVAIFAIALATAVLVRNLRESALSHARSETVSLAKMLLLQTEQTLDSADLVLRGVQERLQTSFGRQFELDSSVVHLLLASRTVGSSYVSALFIVGEDGVVINSSSEYPPKRIMVNDRRYFKAFDGGKGGGSFIDGPVRSRASGSWVLNLARPVTDQKGNFRGVVVAAITIPNFERGMGLLKLEYSRPMSIYMSDGVLVASLPHREASIGEIAPELVGVTLPAPGEDARIASESGGEMLALGRATRFPVLAGVASDEAMTLASWRESAAPTLAVALLMCGAIAVVAVLLVRKVRREEELQSALQEADARYHHTVDAVMDAIVAADESGNIVLFNPAAEKMFGFPASRVVGEALDQLIPARAREAHRRHTEEFGRVEPGSRTMAPRVEITGLRADGTEFPIESTISHTLVGGKRQLTAVLRDVTERRRSDEKLREMNLQLRELSVALQNVREQERSRIALELHDELGQQLTGLKLELSWLGTRLKEGREAPPERVDAMRRQLDAAIASVRRISTELRPRILDDLGFQAAVSWQAGEFSKRSGLPVALDLEAADRVVDNGLATCLFRIVQEALTNVARHADASRVAIRLSVDRGQLVLTVSDDGRGIPDMGPGLSGIGLLSMRERASAFGGRFAAIGAEGSGTTIEVSIPLKEQSAVGIVHEG